MNKVQDTINCITANDCVEINVNFDKTILSLMNNLDSRYSPRTHLDINNITDIANALSTNTVLTSLDLGYCNIGDVGVKILVDALIKNSTLRELYLYRNNINSAGAREISRLLEHNKSVSKLSLASNNIGYAGFLSILASLQKNKSLNILNLLSNNITVLSIDNDIQNISTNTILKEFTLDYNSINSEIISFINKIVNRNIAYENCKARLESFKNNSGVMSDLIPIIDKSLLYMCLE
jgi:hypothetical protein